MKRSKQAGFTLAELMMVVAIIALLTTIAVVYLRANTKPIDVANTYAALVQRASRQAVTWGPVRADVATALGSKRRTRIIAVPGTPMKFQLQKLNEDPGTATATWEVLQEYTVPKQVSVAKYAKAVGTDSSLTAILSTNWTAFELSCFPDGTCDATTLFFEGAWQNSHAVTDRQARMSVLPLGTATLIRPGWN